MLGDKTLLQYVLDNELEDFKKIHEATYQSPGSPLEINGTGSCLIELNSSSTAFQELIDPDHRESIAKLSRRSTDEYRKQLGQKIIKLEDGYTLKYAIKLIHNTYKHVQDKFAGVIFVLETGALINPLHPLVALELLRHPKNTIVSKILIYSYKDLDKIHSLYGKPDSTSFELSIKTLLKVYQSQVKSRDIDILENEFNYENRKLIQKYKVSKFPGEDHSKEYYLVATQLLTKGTYVPYYGTSIIQMNGNTSGYHITPFKSCNLNGHTYKDPISVCTGSTSNKTIAGLRTLHHANLGSPYEHNCMTSLSKPYADACIKQSFEIFKKAQYL